MNKKIVDGWVHIAFLLVICQSILQQEVVLVIEFAVMLVYVIVHKFRIEKSFLIIFGLMVLHSGWALFFNDADFLLILKQIVGITASYAFFYNIICNKRCSDIIKIYLFYVKVLAFFGIAQELAYFFKVSNLYHWSWLVNNQQIGTALNGLFLRIDIIFQEPSFVAYFFAPAAYLAIYRLFNKKSNFLNIWECALILGVYLFTFSSIAYLGIIISVGIVFFGNKNLVKKLWVLAGLIIICLVLYNKVDEFRMRVDDTVNLFFNENSGNENISSVTLHTNFMVMLSSLADKKGFGFGIGNYRYAYEEYISKQTLWYGINMDDGNSLMIRIITELGVLGLCWIVRFCLKYRIKVSEDEDGLSACMFVFVLLILIRQGHYFIGENILFFILYKMIFMEHQKNHLNNVLKDSLISKIERI